MPQPLQLDPSLAICQDELGSSQIPDFKKKVTSSLSSALLFMRWTWRARSKNRAVLTSDN